jgi:regulatory protein
MRSPRPTAKAKEPLGVSELRAKAIALLARREHSRAELLRKLSPHGSIEDIETVLADLQRHNLQSDTRFAESYVRSVGERFGAAKLRHTLRNKGIAADLVEAELDRGELPDETERAKAVWARKFAAAPEDAKEWARQARFLQSRGFSTDVIRRVLKEQE